VDLTLVLPDFLQQVTTSSGARLAGFEELFRDAAESMAFSGGLEALLCFLFAVPRQSDWPCAPLLAQHDGVDARSGYWLCAEPVSLVAARDTVVVTGRPQCLPDETREILASLNSHFEGEGLRLVAGGEDDKGLGCYAHSERSLDVATHSVGELASVSLLEAMPTGPDARFLRRWINEAQMLLHEHPVNRSREARGLPEIAGVWFWGGGQSGELPAPGFDSAWGEDIMLAALCSASGLPAPRAPTSAAEVLSQGGRTLLVLRAGSFATPADFDREWLRPMARAWRSGRIDRLHLLCELGLPGRVEWRRIGSPHRRGMLAALFGRPATTELVERLRESR
jgi:hypothetical protein